MENLTLIFGKIRPQIFLALCILGAIAYVGILNDLVAWRESLPLPRTFFSQMPKTKARPHRPKAGRRETKRVIMPIASVGACRNALRANHMCRNFGVELANGLCLTCWDRSMDDPPVPKAS